MTMRAKSRFAGDKFLALHEFHMALISNKPDLSGTDAVVHSALSDIIKLRLTEAYAPLLDGLQRIEDSVGALADLRADQYQHPRQRITAGDLAAGLAIEHTTWDGEKIVTERISPEEFYGRDI